MTGPDRWYRWLLEVRFGGDAAYREKDLTEFLYPVRDAVLDGARLRPGQTLLDVGTGDGLDPMLDFDDRDLVRYAQDAGFSEISLELRVSVKNHKDPVPWERFLHMSGNPLQPPFQEALQQVLSAQEADELARHLRPLVESGTGLERIALAYLTAVKG